MPTVFVGRVLGPDGAPLAGVVVVSSAGGQALTDEHGDYRLEVEVPLVAESVQLTALGTDGGARLVAGMQVSVGSASVTQTGTPNLQAGECCEPSWVPRFGGRPATDASGNQATCEFQVVVSLPPRVLVR